MECGVDPSRHVPISVITGFLGAGKTTMLWHLLADPACPRTAVIINELGEVPLDHELIERSEEDLVEISGGCLCCTVRGDLSRALRVIDLRRKRRPGLDIGRIVIETTGLADPAPILHTLMTDPMMAYGYRLEGVVTLVDAVNGLATLDRQAEARKQVAVADRVLVTKIDLTGDRIPIDLRERLRVLAPASELDDLSTRRPASLLQGLGPWDAARRGPEVERWLGEAALTGPGHDHTHAHSPSRHDDHIGTYCVRRPAPIPARNLARFLELLMTLAGPRLLRAKGIVKLAEDPARPLVLHAVQHLVHEPIELDEWPSDDRDTRLVFVTRGIERATIEWLTDRLCVG